MDYRTAIYDKQDKEYIFNSYKLTERSVKLLLSAVMTIRNAQRKQNLLIGNCQMLSLHSYYDLLDYGKSPRHIKGIVYSDVETKKIVHFWVEVDDDVIAHDPIHGVYKMPKKEYYSHFQVQFSTDVSVQEHKQILADTLELFYALEDGDVDLKKLYGSNNNAYIPDLMEKLDYLKDNKMSSIQNLEVI